MSVTTVDKAVHVLSFHVIYSSAERNRGRLCGVQGSGVGRQNVRAVAPRAQHVSSRPLARGVSTL